MQGVDGKRPIGFYGNLGADVGDVTGVFLVPIVGAKQFKETLEGLGWEVVGGKDGLFDVNQDELPFEVHYRVVGDYAYVSIGDSKLLVPAGLLTPKAVFGAKPSTAAIAVTVRLNQIPESFRDLFLEGFKDGLGNIDEKAGENKIQKALATALAKYITGTVDSVFKDGEELEVLVDLDAKTKKMAVDVTLMPARNRNWRSKSPAWASARRCSGGCLTKAPALNGVINLKVPPEMGAALNDVLKELTDKAVADVADPAMQKQAGDLLEALKPSLTADDLDAAFSLRGPDKDKHFTLVAGFKLVQGEKLAAVLLEMVKGLPANEQKTIQLNVDKQGAVAIHRLDLKAALDDKTKAIFGEQPLFLAMRENALFVAIGDDGVAAIKQALAAGAAGATTAPLQFDMSMARLAALARTRPRPRRDRLCCKPATRPGYGST